MRASKMLLSTLKEAPVEAKIDSHVLLLRAGMIRSLVAGVYNYLPLGLRSLKKIENIIREEMAVIDANEILSSAVQPRELWDESGRWGKYGPELFRFHDRHDREFCLGPTHEEIFTDLARNLVKSPKALPINLYQIQTKYRDEMRPRFGLIRGREFIMQDSYTFDKDEAGLEVSYKQMYDTYSRIFTRLGLRYKTVLADTGNIGGNGSHQFMALSEIGESTILYCDHCHYAADQEKADMKEDTYKYNEELKEMEVIDTPNQKTIEEISSFLNVQAKDVVKSLIYKNNEDDTFVMALIRGDRELNEVKLCGAAGINEDYLIMATEAEIASLGLYNGFVGPVNAPKEVRIFVDTEVSKMKNVVVGANKANAHIINVNFERDYNGTVVELKMAGEGDLCPECGCEMHTDRGIEVGQVFKLQTKYSKAMNCTYQNEKGENVPMVMGCYGIGVTRTLQAIVEQYHDEYGIKWPVNVAPYEAVVVPVNYKDEAQVELATSIYNDLKVAHIETILDDRDAKPGFKFKDWELMGIPYMIIAGKRASEGIVEVKNRMTLEKQELTVEEAIKFVVSEVERQR